jgi:hypothetical protein
MNDPYALPNFTLVATIVVFGAAAAIVCATLAVLALLAFNRRRAWVLPAGLAAGAAAVAFSVYTWGALHLAMDETQAGEMCMSAVPTEHAGHVSGYETTFVPLHFRCELRDGRKYATAVPDHVNPLAFSAAALSIACTGLAALMRRHAATSSSSTGAST